MLTGRSTIAQPTGLARGVQIVRGSSVTSWEFFKNKPLGGIGALILILLVLMAIFAPHHLPL